MQKNVLRRLAALLLALILTTGSAFASGLPSETVNPGSKWINSDIIGSVDSNTVVSFKDDFHAAVNRDWILQEEDHIGAFDESAQLLYDRQLEIVLGKAPIDPANADAVGLSSEWLNHDLRLLQVFSSLAGEWDCRNELGVDPAIPYLEAIASIQTMEDMNAYLLNENGMNLSGFSLVDINVIPEPEHGHHYMIAFTPNSMYSLSMQDQYIYLQGDGRGNRFATEMAVNYLLSRLGYSESEIRSILVKAFRFEGRLAAETESYATQQSLEYYDDMVSLTYDELQTMTGDYPLTEQLEAFGLDKQETYALYEEHYFKQLGKLYQERYLEEIKAMCTIHTVISLMPLLDEPTYEKLDEIIAMLQSIPKTEEDPVGQDNPEEEVDHEKDDAEFVFDNYIQNYLSEPMDQIYVAAYCTPQLKSEIDAMIDEIIEHYREMILGVEWLSQGAREATVEKLENLAIRCVYPDSFTDYTGLSFAGYRDEQPGNLPQAAAAIEAFDTQRQLELVGEAVQRNRWEMGGGLATTVCNAYYMPLENSINILAGIVTEAMYDPDFSYEEKLGTIGVIIGHEITHAFDTNGYQFDKDGKHNPWWSTEDVEAFDLRASKLIKYYNAITPVPDSDLYSGTMVSGEAIADMGGMKCMLSIAEDIPDFDYEAFFTAFARMWRVQRERFVEESYAKSDVHPLAYLRTNVTVQQFDEFHETYDIQPGDGMYLAPENRISVW